MTFKHRTLIAFSAVIWLIIGTGLLFLGISFIIKTIQYPHLAYLPHRFSLMAFLSGFVKDRQNAAVILLSSGLFIGHLKGRFVLRKTVARQLQRIASLPNPAPLKRLYGKGYYILIASMMLLGMLMRFFPITLDTRGFVDVAIGAALIQGAMLYFRLPSKKLAKDVA